jgi:hypothetical protein
MLSITLQVFMLTSFVALLVLVWRFAKRPNWRTRAVIYGWGASIIWALLWALLMPMWFRGTMDQRTIVTTFPDGTIVMAFLFGGWFWPLIVVGISGYLHRKNPGGDQVG